VLDVRAQKSGNKMKGMSICHNTRLGFYRETKGFYLGITLGVGQIILGFILGRLDQIEFFGHGIEIWDLCRIKIRG
jgi:hypothetical protein